jgi:hypothetical protein
MKKALRCGESAFFMFHFFGKNIINHQHPADMHHNISGFNFFCSKKSYSRYFRVKK